LNEFSESLTITSNPAVQVFKISSEDFSIMVRKFSLLFGTAALAAFMVAPLNADTVSICVGYNGGACTQVDSGNGAAAYLTSNADYSMINVAASGTPTQAEPSLNLNNFNVTTSSSAATSLTIEATETGISSLSSPYTFNQAFAAILYSQGMSISFNNYIDPSNTAYGTTQLIGSTTYNSTGAAFVPASYAGSTAGVGTFGGPFSETEVINITFSGVSQSAFGNDAIAGSVPEPMSLGLLGGGLAALGFMRLRKARKA
jgi:hypothetical protein